MMKNAKRTLVGAVAMMAAACAHAFEFDDAVPLTIGAMQRNARPSDIELVCGLTSRDGAALPATGTIDDADAALSILVISRPAR
ncbi:hypothetical protein [Burkholderia ubonensis]|uniref:hypothetical protein n=1 Tax=Burkholderia ubonensis TaxID=101571 RepID=UPI00016A65C9|nr:hypothetical protein [Burkholderia ubonensis]